MKNSTSRIRLILVLQLLILPTVLAQEGQTQPDTSRYRAINEFYDQNEKCFVCHGAPTYVLEDSVLGSKLKRMCNCRVIKREDFYHSNHKTFGCTDCHSMEYETFPHSREALLEEYLTCIDCHGGDDTWSQYHFDEISAEYDSSAHASLQDFSCWKCHNPHTYKVNIRNTQNLKMSIAYDNEICLSCHSDYDKFRLYTDQEEINIIEKHDWLPNQQAHIRNVRCIECHAEANDTILVAHKILPANQAVKKCTECHSRNSILMGSLYKYQVKNLRSEAGFLNAVIMNDSFVISANRNKYLDLASIIIFTLSCIGIVIHSLFRIFLKH